MSFKEVTREIVQEKEEDESADVKICKGGEEYHYRKRV